MDTKKLYEENLKSRYQDLKNLGWINFPIEYKFNSHGFRTDEFISNENSIMFLGCSHTMGIGLPNHGVWPYLVSKRLNMTCVNLATGGSSPDTAFRMCLGFIDKIKPKIVIYMQPPVGRFELLSPDEVINITVHQQHNMSNYYDLWASTEYNNDLNYLKASLSINSLCKDRNTKFVMTSYEDIKNFSHPNSLARDLSHFGIKTHFLFANNLVNRI